MMKIYTHLPDEIKMFTYAKNHHFIELTDTNGNIAKLNADSVLVGQCLSCGAKLIAFSNMGEMSCTHCGSTNTKWLWANPQLSFIPEKESAFTNVIGEKIKALQQDIEQFKKDSGSKK